MAPWPGIGALALLCLAMFADALVAPGQFVLGRADTDLANQFLPWREFGFRELAQGNLALWNPHIFSGAPFFGGMQSALLYPPNWLFMLLPLPLAVNWVIGLSVWMLGTYMYLWALQRGLKAFAAFLAAAVLMFSAPYILRISAGHLTHLAALAWVPLIFLAIDGWLQQRRAGWCLVGMLAVAMQIFAGHPQYVYFTAIIAGAYAALALRDCGRKRAAVAGLGSMYAGGALLAAVQLLAGIEATTETVRGSALPLEFAAEFDFPAGNLVTLLAPGFFGDGLNLAYWGRWYLWEACAFFGVAALALAAYSMAGGGTKGTRVLAVMSAVALLLAFGPSTPLFRVLFDWLPFFDRFRGTGKFIFFTVLFLALLAGAGMDRLLREGAVSPAALRTGGAFALALLVVALAVRLMDWSALVALTLASGESYEPPRRYFEAGFVAAAQELSSRALLVAGLALAATVGLMATIRFEKRAVFVLGALAVAEVFAFARLHRPMFDRTQIQSAELQEFLARDPGDYRILNTDNYNKAITMGALDAWGYDPLVTRRYAELIHWSQGADPARATQRFSFGRDHPVLSMLRVKYAIAKEQGEPRIIRLAAAPLRRLELVGSYRVLPDRAAVLQALVDPSFDPRKRVILEQEPQPAPLAGALQGRAVMVRDGTDFMEIEAEVALPSVLLVTDAWSSGWRAVALEGSSAGRYELMPANYALRAIALGPGLHRIRLEYAPASFRLGVALSVLAWAAWLAAAWRLRRRPGRAAHA